MAKTFDGNWRLAFADIVASEPAFAWLPVTLWTGQRVWLRKVYRIYAYKHQNLWGGPDRSVHYSLTIPWDAV